MTLRKTKIWNSFLLLVFLSGIHPSDAIENELRPIWVEVSQVVEDSSEEATITVLGSPVLIKSDCRAKPCRAEYQVKLQTNGLRSNALLVGTERKKIMLNQFDQFDVPLIFADVTKPIQFEILSVDKVGDVSQWLLVARHEEPVVRHEKPVVIEDPFHFRAVLGMASVKYEQDLSTPYSEYAARASVFANYLVGLKWSGYGQFTADLLPVVRTQGVQSLRFFNLELGAHYQNFFSADALNFGARLGLLFGSSMGNQTLGYNVFSTPVLSLVMTHQMANQDFIEAILKYSLFASDVNGIKRLDNQRTELVTRYQFSAQKNQPAYGIELSAQWLKIKSAASLNASSTQYFLGGTIQY